MAAESRPCSARTVHSADHRRVFVHVSRRLSALVDAAFSPPTDDGPRCAAHATWGRRRVRSASPAGFPDRRQPALSETNKSASTSCRLRWSVDVQRSLLSMKGLPSAATYRGRDSSDHATRGSEATRAGPRTSTSCRRPWICKRRARLETLLRSLDDPVLRRVTSGVREETSSGRPMTRAFSGLGDMTTRAWPASGSSTRRRPVEPHIKSIRLRGYAGHVSDRRRARRAPGLSFGTSGPRHSAGFHDCALGGQGCDPSRRPSGLREFG